MSLRARVFLESPSVAAEDVRRAIFRFSARGGFDSGERVEIIGDERSGSATPVRGPEGFSLAAVRLRKDGEARGWISHDYTALHLVEGAACVRTDGRDQLLETRDTLLVPPGVSCSVCPRGSDECTFVEIAFSERGTTRRRSRQGLARLRDMVPVRKRFPVSLAPRLNDILSPETLYPVIGPVAHGPGRFQIVGPDELVVALATTSRGTGPALHVHRHSTEMFVVVAGKFRITWGDEGEHETLLDPFDAIVVPRGVNRAFEAAGDGENWILPVVVGTNDESEDIVFFPEVEERLKRAGRFAALLSTSTRIRIGERAPRRT